MSDTRDSSRAAGVHAALLRAAARAEALAVATGTKLVRVRDGRVVYDTPTAQPSGVKGTAVNIDDSVPFKGR